MNKMLVHFITILFLAICINISHADNTLSSSKKRAIIHPNLIAFNSKEGKNLFEESQHKNSFFALSQYFVTQKNLTYCGIASSAIVLNALPINAPLTPSHAPYRIFNQENVFNQQVLENLTPTKVNIAGATLEQIANLLKKQAANIKVETHFATANNNKNNNIDKFRTIAKKALATQDKFIIINYCRKNIGEEGCGHFSPIAAYNSKSDSFLILDVARYKYPPVWVKTKLLFESMTGIDSASNKSRGYLVISSD